jgi:crotonobetainyl-CoA:carnitine CoA-transferase CaiB-like acyl-CoA transferase
MPKRAHSRTAHERATGTRAAACAANRQHCAPLAGFVVIELGHSVAAPYAGQILGDLGAEVIKIEKAQGDDARKWGPPFWEGAAATFQGLNRNKQSVVCDLRDPRQVAALKKLVAERADIVLQNMRPGQAEEVGLGSADLIALKPSLIYCNVGAFGRAGPLAARPGYDPLMQAFGGIMSVTGTEGQAPVRVGPSIVDMGTGMWAAIGILAAISRRKDTGRGATIDVSLFETSAQWMSLLAAQYLASGELPRKLGSGSPGIVPYRAYRAADGDLVVAAGNDALFRKLCHALGRDEWADDARFVTNPERVRNQGRLYAMIEPLFLQRACAEWVERLDAAGVPCAPVQNVQSMMEHEQTRALGLLQAVPNSGMKLLGLPISFDGERPQPRSAPPALGEHTAAVMSKVSALPASKRKARGSRLPVRH